MANPAHPGPSPPVITPIPAIVTTKAEMISVLKQSHRFAVHRKKKARWFASTLVLYTRINYFSSFIFKNLFSDPYARMVVAPLIGLIYNKNTLASLKIGHIWDF